MPTPKNAPKPVAQFIRAVNAGDLELCLSVFAEDAIVNDQLCEHRGPEEIRRWAREELIGKALRLNVVDAHRHYANYILSAEVDGDFDKLGLPDPLLQQFYFTHRRGRLVQLTILPNLGLGTKD